MATIKSFSDLEQSRKLAEILPIESADMWYQYTGISIKDSSKKPIYFPMVIRDCESDEDIPCWSLAALLEVLHENKICHYKDRYYCQYMNEGDEFPIYSTAEYDNPVDACVDMIEKLHGLNLL